MKCRTNLSPTHTGLTKVEDVTALGVTFTKTLSFEPHVLKVANKKGNNMFVRAKDAKSPRLTGPGLTRCYPGHTNSATPLR